MVAEKELKRPLDMQVFDPARGIKQTIQFIQAQRSRYA